VAARGRLLSFLSGLLLTVAALVLLVVNIRELRRG
jgi:hypothetical protein